LANSNRRLGWFLDHPRATNAGLDFAQNALFPRLSHRLRWPSRLGAGATALYVVGRVASTVVLIYLLARGARRLEAKREAARAELRTQLGREPTNDDLFEYFMEEG
jgi:hypothetical protein